MHCACNQYTHSLGLTVGENGMPCACNQYTHTLGLNGNHGSLEFEA